MRYMVLVISIVLVVFLISSCGEEDEEPAPTTGTVSGTVTFVGAPPEEGGEIRVSIFSILDENGDPMGPPDSYSELFTEFTGDVPYKISGVSFGTYKLAAVGYKAPDWPPGRQTILGACGQADFTVSEEQPDVAGIDITADYAAIQQ